MSETLRYNGQTVVVTGASRGIGRELARLFASRGACVVVNGRTRETVDKQVAEIVSAGGTATGNVGDVSVSSNAKALIEQALDHYGRIDAVINNAGILGFSPIESMSVEDFDAVFNVNLRGAFNVTQAAWPTMKKACYGRVIFLPSHAIFGAADSSHYALSKGALFGLMRALAIEGKAHHIQVNAVMPFAVTDMMMNAMSSGASIVDGDTSALVAAAPHLRPDLIAPIVAWLSHATSTVTGELFTTGGGRVARVFLGETPGYFSPDLSPEVVRDRYQDITREPGYTVPTELTQSLGLVVAALQRASQP